MQGRVEDRYCLNIKMEIIFGHIFSHELVAIRVYFRDILISYFSQRWFKMNILLSMIIGKLLDSSDPSDYYNIKRYIIKFISGDRP